MKLIVTGAAIAVLLGSAAISRAQAPAQPGAQQPAAPQRTVQVPPGLPPPVGEDRRVKGEDIDKVLGQPNVILLDVREPWELEQYGTRKGYINIPIGQLEQRLNELPKDKLILTA